MKTFPAWVRSATVVALCALPNIAAAERFFGYNATTATDFSGVFLAPEGSGKWGPNEALNDKDKRWDAGERLPIRNASRARYDLRLVDQKGHACIKRGIDLLHDTTFDVRDEDLASCGQ